MGRLATDTSLRTDHPAGMDADSHLSTHVAPSSRTSSMRSIAGLQVRCWEGSGRTVLGLPGLGSGGVVWTPLAQELAEANVVAPDLRGRGASSSLPGPPGLQAHARDIAAIADELDLHDVVLVGHSMGAYLAPVVAQEVPDRIRRIVLVDGGIPPALPFFMGPRLTRWTFGRDLRKADRDWPDVETFVQTAAGRALRSRPDLLPIFSWLLAEDLHGPAGAMRPRLDGPRAVEDAVDTFFGGAVVPALEALQVPAHLVAASHGKHDKAKPFLSEQVVQEWTARLPLLTAERVEANHVTVLFSSQVTRAVAG